MTYAPRPNEFVPYYDVLPVSVARAAVTRPSLWRRLVGAVFESREKQMELEAERYIARTGGRITDEIEREITDRLVTGKWRH
jgi:hypothetical protein